MKKSGKSIAIFVLFLIEAVVTFMSFYKKWGVEINSALLFAGIMIFYSGFSSILDRFNPELKEFREDSTREHDEIKGAIALYKDIELLNSVVDYEGRYVKNQKCSEVEIWVISNTVAEPEAVIEKMYHNLIKGAKYYYVIPNNNVNRSEEDLINTFEKIKQQNKSKKCLSIKYIQDDLFDLMPTDIADIIYYCNPKGTDYSDTGISDNMKVFISFQNDNYNKEIYYKPIALSEAQKNKIFLRMTEWKNNREWKELK